MSDAASTAKRAAPKVKNTVFKAVLELLEELGYSYYDDADSFKDFYDWFVPHVAEPTELGDDESKA